MYFTYTMSIIVIKHHHTGTPMGKAIVIDASSARKEAVLHVRTLLAAEVLGRP